MASRFSNPLRVYAGLELGVAASVGGYFFILPAFHAVYPSLYAWFGASHGALVLAKLLLAMVALVPAAFFIGGTLPIASQYIVRRMDRMGRKVSILYAVNTTGAAVGAMLAGFYLPTWLGYRDSYLLAIGLTVAVGLCALLLSRGAALADPSTSEPRPSRADVPGALSSIRGLALLSGLVTLSLQVLWTRMLAQVLQNSVYTFCIILVTSLVSMALGAGIANLTMRTRVSPITALVGAMTGAALLIAASPFAMHAWTDGLGYIGAGAAWDGYVLRVFAMSAVVIGLPTTLSGMVFPLLLQLAQGHDRRAGRPVGQLTALNTVGAIIGSLLAGFVILNWIGMWAGIRLMGVVYLLAALHLLYAQRPAGWRVTAIPMAGILLLTSILDPSRLPLVGVDPIARRESLVEVWEGSASTVAVVRRGDGLKIKVDNHYALGGTVAHELEALQGYLPILLHPKAESVYFLGLGTGITAGAGLKFPIRRLVVTELLPEVVTASRTYFGEFNHGLFEDPRAEVIVEDGRNYLAATRERFDVIIADLFVPWKAGAGNLYSLEHYQTLRERLNPHGLFMQWLPAYQLSQEEFAIIARTMLEVFPQVTVWRGDFFARKPILGLLGQAKETPLPADAALFAVEQVPGDPERVPLLAHYVGNLDRLRTELMNYPLNRDDAPIIEYHAPITQRLQRAKKLAWLAGEELLHFMDAVQQSLPPERDGYLRNLTDKQRRLPNAGLHLHRAQVLKEHGDLDAAREEVKRFEQWVAGVGEG